MATVRTGVTMSKAAIKALADRIEKMTDVTQIELRLTAIEDKTALIAEIHHDDQREPWTETLLVVNDGVVKL